jgi:hypothetical protein
VSYRTILFRTTPISTEPYSWVGFHIFKALCLCRTCLWTGDVRYKMQAISSSARQPKSWLTGPPSTAMKLAFTWKFILTNKQKPVQASLKGTCLSFSLNSETLIKLRNADDLYVPAHKMASVKRVPFFTFQNDWNDKRVLVYWRLFQIDKAVH